jgi:lysophospholipase L1-like esterase
MMPLRVMMDRGSPDAVVTALFAAGEQGVFFDVQDLTSMFQDTAGTIPVTAVGQTVKRINDKSGRGNHATNASGWVLYLSGSRYRLLVSGSTVFTTAAFAFGSDKASIWAGVSNIGVGGTVCSFGNITANTGSFALNYYQAGPLQYRRGSATFGARGAQPAGGAPIVVSSLLDLGGGTTQATQNPSLLVDDVQGALTGYGVANAGVGPFGTYALSIGGGVDTLNGGFFYGLIIRAGTSTLAPVGAYVTAKVRDPAAFSVMQFHDSGSQNTFGKTYQLTSPFAHADFTTTATSATVTTYNDLYDRFPQFAEVGVYVDGVWNQSIAIPSLGVNTASITLPAGSKRVAFVNGVQSLPNDFYFQGGFFVTDVKANATLTPVTPSPTNRVVVYGDSILVGDACTTATKEAWPMLTRAAYYPNSLAVEGFGYRMLKTDCLNSTLRAAFVAKMTAYAPARIWLAIGTNDYGLSGWTAAAFGTAYAALLDDLHTALPSATIFCQTPIVRATETANSNGSTLGDYRSAISTAVSTRTGYATLVDGTAIVTLSDLADGTHPTTAGHAKYATYVRGILGI